VKSPGQVWDLWAVIVNFNFRRRFITCTLFPKYYRHGKFKEFGISGACSIHVKDEKCIQNFSQKIFKKEGVDWIHLAWNMVQWQAVVNMGMNIQVS
jgi:hypothetical protein